MKLNKKGFTLVELLAVIVVLALLMVVSATTIGGALDRSKKAATKTEASKLLTSIYSEERSALLLNTSYKGPGAPGSETISAEKTDGDVFKYKYQISISGSNLSIDKFCLKHSDGFWVTGTANKDGKIVVNEPTSTIPSDNVCVS